MFSSIKTCSAEHEQPGTVGWKPFVDFFQFIPHIAENVDVVFQYQRVDSGFFNSPVCLLMRQGASDFTWPRVPMIMAAESSAVKRSVCFFRRKSASVDGFNHLYVKVGMCIKLFIKRPETVCRLRKIDYQCFHRWMVFEIMRRVNIRIPFVNAKCKQSELFGIVGRRSREISVNNPDDG